jgi:hypothetical protein
VPFVQYNVVPQNAPPRRWIRAQQVFLILVLVNICEQAATAAAATAAAVTEDTFRDMAWQPGAAAQPAH